MAETDEQVVQNQEENEPSGQFFRPKWQSMVIMILLFVAFYLCFMFLVGWKFATVLLVCLTVHEAGHLWAMWRCGMQLKGLYFLPGLGVAAVPASNFTSRADEAYIAIMGPVWGTAAGVAAYGLYLVTGLPELASAAWLCVLINLFNMIPVAPLDGGRVIRSAAHGLSAGASVWICAVLYVVSLILIYNFSWLFALLLIFFGTQELLRHRLVVHLDEDYRRIKSAIENGGDRYSHLLTIEAEPTDENVQLMGELADQRVNRFGIWPFGFLPMTPDDYVTYPKLLQQYLANYQVSPAMTVRGGLLYIGLFLGLALFLVVLGQFCHAAVPIASWMQPLIG